MSSIFKRLPGRTDRIRVAVIGFQFAALIGAAEAASVTWGVPQAVTGESDVSLNGTLVGAANLDGPNAVVNGVTFQAVDIDNAAATVGGFTVDGFFFNQFNPAFSTASSSAPFSGLNAGYQSLLGTGALVGGTMTLSISGLTVGMTYEFQAWVNDSRNQTPPGFTFGVLVFAGNDVQLDPNPSLLEGGLGQFVTGTFVADQTTQEVTFDNSESAVINGFQLRSLLVTVPESGSWMAGVWVVAASSTAVWRSRRRDL